jgi:ribosomal protein L19E
MNKKRKKEKREGLRERGREGGRKKGKKEGRKEGKKDMQQHVRISRKLCLLKIYYPKGYILYDLIYIALVK